VAGTISDTVTVSGQPTACTGDSATMNVSIAVEPGPAVDPPSLTLSGAPGQTVEGTVSITGGAPPYQAISTVGATTTLTNGTLTYSFTIPSDAQADISDTIDVTDALGASVQVPVAIDVGVPLTSSPESLSLSAEALVNVDSVATGTLAVSGGLPPYALEVSSGPGTVEPTALSAPGEATYRLVIPADTPVPATFEATVELRDARGALRRISVTVELSAANPITRRTDLTPNQRSVGAAIETLCPALGAMGDGNRTAGQQDLFEQCNDMLENATSAAIPNTLSQITNEKARASTRVGVEAAKQQFANIGSRLAALRRGTTGLSLQGLNFNLEGMSLPSGQISDLLSPRAWGGGASADESESAFAPWGFFLNGSLYFGDKDATINEAGFDFETAGVTAGADYRFNDRFVAGGALGFARDNTDFDASGGGLDTDTWRLSAYGTYYLSDRWYVDGILGYGWHDYDSRRGIRYRLADNPVDRSATSSYDGRQYGGSLGAGYNFNRDALTLALYGRLSYTKVDVDGFEETDALGLNLRLRDFDATSLTTSLGGRISRAISTTKAVLVPQVWFEWEHEYDDDATLLVAQFVHDPTATRFNVFTDNPDRNYFRFGLGLNATFAGGVSAFLSYDTLLDRDDWTRHAVDFGVRWEF
jgi:uncharacterized protein with beta-barrel porin domain